MWRRVVKHRSLRLSPMMSSDGLPLSGMRTAVPFSTSLFPPATARCLLWGYLVFLRFFFGYDVDFGGVGSESAGEGGSGGEWC